jgi:hypothetical protein
MRHFGSGIRRKARSGEAATVEAMSPAWLGDGTAEGAPDDEDGGLRPAALRIGLLVAALALVTVGGIVVGKAIESGTSPGSATTSSTPAVSTTTVGRLVAPPAVPLRWGPLPVQVYGRFPPGGDRAGAALAGPALVVAGGTGSDAVVAGRIGGPLRPAGTLPGPLAAPAVFTVGATTYVLGGERGQTPTDAILRLDLAGHRVLPAGTFEEPLAETGLAARAGAVFLVGGWTGTQYATAVLRFTPPGTVLLITRLPTGVRSPAVALLRHTLYVAGGRTAGGVSRELYAVDLDTGTLTTLAALPRPVEQAVLLVSGPRLYLVGGRGADGRPLATVLGIDPATGQARPAGRLPAPLAGATAVRLGGRTLVVDPPAGRVYRVG